MQVAEQEFNLLLPSMAYLNVLRVCATDGTEPAARFALRIVDGLRVHTWESSTLSNNDHNQSLQSAARSQRPWSIHREQVASAIRSLARGAPPSIYM